MKILTEIQKQKDRISCSENTALSIVIY